MKNLFILLVLLMAIFTQTGCVSSQWHSESTPLWSEARATRYQTEYIYTDRYFINIGGAGRFGPSDSYIRGWHDGRHGGYSGGHWRRN